MYRTGSEIFLPVDWQEGGSHLAEIGNTEEFKGSLPTVEEIPPYVKGTKIGACIMMCALAYERKRTGKGRIKEREKAEKRSSRFDIYVFAVE